MDFMPFADINDEQFFEPFPENYDLAYDEDGEWVYYNGEWMLAGPPLYDQAQLDYAFNQLYYNQAQLDYAFNQLYYAQAQLDAYNYDQAQLNDALHFGYETYGQDGPPAPLLAQDPLDYPLYDYDDPRDLD